MQLLLEITTFLLLLCFLVFPKLTEAQSSDTAHEELCECLLQTRMQTEHYQTIDSLLAAGVELNGECVASKRYRNVVSDGLVNAWRSVGDALSKGRRTVRQRTYNTRYKYYRPIYLAREDTALLFKLMREGADPHLSSHDAPSVLAFFTSEDRLDVLQRLVDLGAEPSKMDVVYSEEKKTIDFLMEKGAKKEALSLEAILKGRESVAILKAYDLKLDGLSCSKSLKPRARLSNWGKTSLPRSIRMLWRWAF